MIVNLGAHEAGGLVFSSCRSALFATTLPVMATCFRHGSVGMSMVGLLGQRFNCAVDVYDVLAALVAGVTITFNAT